jgi:hypothetical protein
MWWAWLPGPLAQAVLVIAFLRTSLTYAELAAGSGIARAKVPVFLRYRAQNG